MSNDLHNDWWYTIHVPETASGDEDPMRSKMNTRPATWAAWLWLPALTAVAGCGSDELASPTAKRLTGLANFYLEYAVAKNGKGPASEQDLKKHMRSQPGFVLEMNGLDPKFIDSAFVSERDQEPFVVRYGLSITHMSGDSTQLIAHEKVGKHGKRLVVYASTKVDLVSEGKLQELTAKP